MTDASSPDPTQPAEQPPPPPPPPGPGPAQAPWPAQAPPGAGYGDLGQRFLARLLDYLVVGIPVNIVIGLIPGLGFGSLVGSVLATAVLYGYFVLLETSQGATLGKQWLGLAVTGEAGGGGPITTDASLRRNWWMLLGALGGLPVIGWLAGLASLAVVIVIVVTISSDPRNQGWHDKLAGTLVVRRR